MSGPEASGASKPDQPILSRRDELLKSPRATFRSPKLRKEFVAEHISLMRRFEPLRERIDNRELDAEEVAMAVLREHVRLSKLKTTS